MIALVFGLCMSANAAARSYGGCDGFSFKSNDPCTIVLSAVNCMFMLVLAVMMLKFVRSLGGGGGGSPY